MNIIKNRSDNLKGAVQGNRRLYLAVATIAAFVVLFYPLERVLGPGITALSLLPVAVCAWLFGLRGGLISAAVVFLFTLFPYIFRENADDFLTSTGAVAGTLALLFTGLVVGYLHDLKDYLKRELEKRTRMQAALQLSENRYRRLFERVSQAFAVHEFILDAEGRAADFRFLDVNEAFQQMVGLEREAILRKTGSEVYTLLEPFWLEQYTRVAFTGRTARFERYSRSLGRYFEVLVFSPAYGQFAALFLDISDRKRDEKELRYASHHDSLTSLFNRAYFDQALEKAEAENVFPLSVLFADVNNLKKMNDDCGHAAGDDLLRAVALVFQASFRAADVIARVGGDEFAVLMPYTNATGARIAEQRLRAKIEQYNQSAQNQEVFLAIGVATSTMGQAVNAVVKAADEAMYREKQAIR